MSNRFMQQFRFSLEKKPTDIWAQATIGASGAPTLVAAKSKGVKSIVRNSAGDYTWTLSDTYNRVLSFEALFQSATGIPAAPSVGLKGAPAVGTLAAPVINFVCSTAGGGAATDPGSGETMYLHAELSDSSAI